MKRRSSGKLSAFEVAVKKGDGTLLKDTPYNFTLEEAIDSIFKLWQYLDCPNFTALHWISTWWILDFNRKATAFKLNMKPKSLDKRIERLERVYHESCCLLSLKDAISGIFILYGRLNCSNFKRLYWIHTWWDKEFDREKTALKLNISIERLHKRIERLNADYYSSESKSQRGTCIPDNIRKMIKNPEDEDSE